MDEFKFKLEFTQEEVQVLYALIGSNPYTHAAPFMDNIRIQLNKQTQPDKLEVVHKSE
jgi:hypothetical protein